ncbi:MAG: phage virion morphogenesis protein [Ectothiorhodospiraceae bacterium]|nr:phage virion morphogenesis protein [Ectothiorhodospiraceae bacterium]
MNEADLNRLESWAEPLLRRLSASERRQLTRRLAVELRRNNQRRMHGQRAPDGPRWQPRKARSLRGGRGRIRRGAMFTRLRTARYLRMQSQPGSATLYFTGRAGRIAGVHHHGRRDRIQPGGPMYDYPSRPLLGFAREDVLLIENLLIDHLTPPR